MKISQTTQKLQKAKDIEIKRPLANHASTKEFQKNISNPNFENISSSSLLKGNALQQME